MLIAKVQDGQVVDIADYKSMFPQTSFPESGVNAEFLSDNSCMTVTVWKSYDPSTQKLESCTPYIERDTVYTVRVVELPAQEVIQVVPNEVTLGQDTVPGA